MKRTPSPIPPPPPPSPEALYLLLQREWSEELLGRKPNWEKLTDLHSQLMLLELLLPEPAAHNWGQK